MQVNNPAILIPEFNVPFIICISTESDNVRIDRYLADILPELSRTYIQKLIRDGMILVNGKTVKSNYRLSTGNELSITIPEPEKLDIVPEDIPIDIIHEDNDIIIVNKPKGMVVHPAPGHYTGTLVNALLFHCRDNLSGINGVMRPGIVHRIDRDTTGLLVVCKNDISHRFVAQQLACHSINRVYHAIVHGNVRNESGTIDKNISRNPHDRKKMCVCSTECGKRAVTHYDVIERLLPKAQDGHCHTYIECRLETGRTHQIRVHMASIGHPLLGDAIYSNLKQPFHTYGQVLHAKTLGFIHPSTNQYIEFNSELPDYFKVLINNMKYK